MFSANVESLIVSKEQIDENTRVPGVNVFTSNIMQAGVCGFCKGSTPDDRPVRIECPLPGVEATSAHGA